MFPQPYDLWYKMSIMADLHRIICKYKKKYYQIHFQFIDQIFVTSIKLENWIQHIYHTILSFPLTTNIKNTHAEWIRMCMGVLCFMYDTSIRYCFFLVVLTSTTKITLHDYAICTSVCTVFSCLFIIKW